MIGLYKLKNHIGQMLKGEEKKIIKILDFINLKDISDIEIIYSEILTSKIKKISVLELGKSVFIYKSDASFNDEELIKSKKYYTDILNSTKAILTYLNVLFIEGFKNLTWLWHDFFEIDNNSFKFKKSMEGKNILNKLVNYCKQKKYGKNVESIILDTFQPESDIINEIELMYNDKNRQSENTLSIVLVKDIDYGNEQIEYVNFIDNQTIQKASHEKYSSLINDEVQIKNYMRIIGNEDFKSIIIKNQISINSFYCISFPLFIRNEYYDLITYPISIFKCDFTENFNFYEYTNFLSQYEIDNLISKKQECCFLYQFKNSYIKSYRNKLQLKMKIENIAYFVDLDYDLFDSVNIDDTFIGNALLCLSFINGNPKFTAKALFGYSDIPFDRSNGNQNNILELNNFLDILEDDDLPF